MTGVKEIKYLKRAYVFTSALAIALFLLAYLFFSSEIFFVYLVAVGFFTVFTYWVIYQSHHSIKSSKNDSMLGVVTVSFLVKLMFSLVFLISFKKYLDPTSKEYIMHYLIIYVIYLICDVYLITLLSRRAK